MPRHLKRGVDASATSRRPTPGCVRWSNKSSPTLDAQKDAAVREPVAEIR